MPHVRHHTCGSSPLPHVALPPSPSPLGSVQTLRRLEIVADGLPLFGGAQLAIDTSWCRSCTATGQLVPEWRTWMAQPIAVARRRKERAYPELVGQRARTRLVVLAGEVGGRWSGETRSQLAKAKARQMPVVLRRRTEQAWRLRCASFVVLCCCQSLRCISPRITGRSGR